MSSIIIINDLAHTRRLDRRALATVRGGAGWTPDVNVNVSVMQQIAQFQQIGINVLNNNGIIGAGFAAPAMSLAPQQWARNHAELPL